MDATADAQVLNQLFACARYNRGRDIIAANPGFCRLFNTQLEALQDKGEVAFRPLAHNPVDDAAWKHILSSGKAQFQWQAPDRRWFLSRFVRVGERDQVGTEIFEVVAEISAIKKKEVELTSRMIALGNATGLMRLSPDGFITEVNSQFAGLIGQDADACVGRHFTALFEKNTQKAADLNRILPTLHKGEPYSAELCFMDRDRFRRWLRCTFAPVMDDEGHLFEILHYAFDITEQKTVHAEFRAQVTAIEKSNAMVTFDMAGTILDANAHFLQATGYAREDIIGRHHRMFVERSSAYGVDYAVFWSDLRQGKHRSGLFKRFGKDGRELWLQATYNPIADTNGELIKVVKYASVVTEEKLLQAEHQSQIAAIHQTQCVIAFDLDGTILDANDNFLNAMGYRFSEVNGQHHRMFVDPTYATSPDYAQFWQDLAQGQHKSGEYRRLRKDGRDVWLQATYNPIMDMSGRTFKIVKYATDITAERERHVDVQGQITAIQRSQGVAFFDMDGTILEVNDNLLETLGYQLSELQGRHHSKLVGREAAESPEYLAFWQELRKGTYQSGLQKRFGKDGREIWLQCSYNPILDLNGRPLKVMKIATDVSANIALAEAFEDAKRQAQHDVATSLPNRAKLMSFMNAMLASQGGSMVVFYIDLDRFKPVNDTHGHHVGDRVLGEVADRLRRVIRDDQLVARVGGDEFVIAAPGLPTEAIDRFCQRLLETVTAPIHHETGEISIGVSVGIAIAPTDGSTPDELLRAADSALYKSKQNGRGQYSFFSSEMNERINARRRLAEDMRHSLAAGDFIVEYQPRFDTRARKIRSVEALVRWEHPERGRISPADFIPLAEQCGIITPLGEWVLRTACATAVNWEGVGVSVNVSPVQFHDPQFVEKVAACLQETGLPPHLLELEITEGVLLDDAARATETLEALKKLGLRLAMDDFGTGYSSLSYLRNFPFDVIKIDRSFVSDIATNQGARHIVQAILGLGRALGLSVTAEGVETNEQLTLLTADHCDEVQGFLLARPLRSSKIDELIVELSSQQSKRHAT